MSTKTALITGASGGIGRALAYEFAKRNYNLVLVARRSTLLMELATDLKNQYSIDSTIIVCDLNTSTAVNEILTVIKEKNIQIDALINNAGIGEFGYFVENKIERIQAMIQINMTTLVNLTLAILPGMRERQYGYILNVASTAGLETVPMMSVYAASKAFVVQFTHAIAMENRDSPIHITVLCPGPTLTDFAKSANMTDAKPFSTPLMDILSAEEVARMGANALFMHQEICIPGWRNRLMLVLGKLLPGKLKRYLTYYFMKKR
jgi:short-subunit dehydrogenase